MLTMKTGIKYFLIVILLVSFGCTSGLKGKKELYSLSSYGVKYGSVLSIFGKNFDTTPGTYNILLTDSVKLYTLAPLSVTRDEIKVEIYNQEHPSELLDIKSFYVGIKASGAVIWCRNKVSLVSAWRKLSDFPGIPRYMTPSFSIDRNCYLGCGAGKGIVLKDFWKYSPSTGTWKQLADFPGAARVYPRAFSNSAYGFLGSGYTADNSTRSQLYDFYKYNPQSDSWSPFSDYPDKILKFYIGYSVTVNGRPFVSLSNDVPKMRELNKDKWKPVATIPELIDCPASGVFSIGHKFYVVVGDRTNNTVSNSVWEYDTENEQWTRKSDFPGPARFAPGYFSVGKYGYYGCGRSTDKLQYSDMWRYDPKNDKWLRIEDFPGGIRSHLVSLSNGKSGFMGLGIIFWSVTYCRDFWRFDP
jgi:N-acetylneuraminic acid mutarotase